MSANASTGTGTTTSSSAMLAPVRRASQAATTSGSLDTGLAKVSHNPVNLRGSLKELPQEGSCESNQEGSASLANHVGTPLTGATGAQPECTSIVGGASTRFARGQRRQFVYRSSPTRGACPGR